MFKLNLCMCKILNYILHLKQLTLARGQNYCATLPVFSLRKDISRATKIKLFYGLRKNILILSY